MKRIAVFLIMLLASTLASAQIFEDYFNESEFNYFEYNPECSGLSDNQFYDVTEACWDQVASYDDISSSQFKVALKKYSQCLEKKGIPQSVQQRCIAQNKAEMNSPIGARAGFQDMAKALQQMASQRGSDQISLPIPPKSQLINHMYPEDIGGQVGAMKVNLAAAVFVSDMDMKQMAEFYRGKVGDFLEYRHGNGDISFIKGAGVEVKQPKELLKAQMEKPNIQITKRINMMTGQPASGSQVTLFYQR
ncbi:hypothetical protein M3P05_15230 [Sansalvadorimonas sp. 2012CJ34-2]|uniref:Uncharacterized protein n=1 Tax=Parendozoicomonas callyspongiae TaxID=2942213 RepID=A0ABT0PIT8_9GAMM|nr:hypothetical protein [Sansalvadorimonas sp. 2012CJ34-2]MCL6271278.1 hypothetical protein [Sansalvadorimonas sp. 2012CJ34-2]